MCLLLFILEVLGVLLRCHWQPLLRWLQILFFFFPFPSPIYSFFFNWIFYLFDFQIVFPFQVYSLQIPDAIPLILLLWGCSHTSYPLLPHYHCILLHWGIKPPQYEGTPLPLMPGPPSSLCGISANVIPVEVLGGSCFLVIWYFLVATPSSTRHTVLRIFLITLLFCVSQMMDYAPSLFLLNHRKSFFPDQVIIE